MQWKFPLVGELVSSVLAAEKLDINRSSSIFGGPKIGYKIFKYGRDESVILFREDEKKRMELIKPYGAAQVRNYVFVSN